MCKKDAYFSKKILIIGPQQSGKYTLLQKFSNQVIQDKNPDFNIKVIDFGYKEYKLKDSRTPLQTQQLQRIQQKYKHKQILIQQISGNNEQQKRWLLYLPNTNMIIYVIDGNKDIKEQIQLIETVSKSPDSRHCRIILFINKIPLKQIRSVQDQLKQIAQIEIKKYFKQNCEIVIGSLTNYFSINEMLINILQL